MEQKRRTITTHTSQRRRENKKKMWTIIGVVLGLALVFFVSYKIAFGLITAGENNSKPETAISSSTEEDIANMSREDLEDSYMKLKKQLEEKDEEIEMLKKRLDDKETDDTPAATETPSETQAPTETAKPTAPPAATKAPETPPSAEQAPPAATQAPSGGLMSPEQLQQQAGL